MTPPSAAPFRAPCYELEDGVRLAPIPADASARLASLFAGIDPWARYAYPASRLADYFTREEPSAPRFAIFSKGSVAGVVVLRLEWLRGPFLQFLGIIPDAQGQGLGRSILAWMEAEARRGAERNIWITASGFNTGALSFYERHGYVRAARLDDLVADGYAEILLRKRLA